MSNETQVLVVGAGPTGLAAAMTLAQQGVDVQIVDAAESNKYGSRAAVVHAHTLEILDTLGATTEIIERGIICKELNFRSTSENSLVKVDFSMIKKYTRFPFSVLISQAEVEGILQRKLEAQGLQIQRGKEITGIKRIHGDKAEVLFADNTTIVTKYIVGADGAHSVVRHLVGIDFKNPETGAFYDDPSDTETFQMALADVYLDDPLPETLYKDQPSFLLDRYTLLIPLPSPDPKRLMWRLGLGMPSGSELPHSPSIEYLQQELNKRNPFSTPLTISSVLVSSRYRVRAALADAYTAKISEAHVLLIGDAAHVHSPVGGQGMNLGICDAVSAAHTIYAHMNSSASHAEKDAIFATYGKKRREAGARVVGLAMTMTKVLALGGSTWKRTLRNAAMKILLSFPPIRRMVVWRVSGLVNRPNDI